MNTEKELSDLLYDHYLEHLASEPPQVEGFQNELAALLKDLPHKENDRIQCAVNALCSEQERYAFLEGVRLGARMVYTLTK